MLVALTCSATLLQAESSPILDYDDLLRHLKQRQKEETQLQQQREASYVAARNQLKNRLAQAEQDFLRVQDSSNPLKKQTTANAERIAQLQKDISQTTNDLAGMNALLHRAATRAHTALPSNAAMSLAQQLSQLDALEQSLNKQDLHTETDLASLMQLHRLLLDIQNQTAQNGTGLVSQRQLSGNNTESITVDPSLGHAGNKLSQTSASEAAYTRPAQSNNARYLPIMLVTLLVFAVSLTLLQRWTATVTRYALPLAFMLSIGVTAVFFSTMYYLMHRPTNWKNILDNSLVVQLDVKKYKAKPVEQPQETPKDLSKPPAPPDLKTPPPLALPTPKIDIPAPTDLDMPKMDVPSVISSNASNFSSGQFGTGSGRGGWSPPAPDKVLASTTTAGKKDSGFREILPTATRVPNIPKVAWDNKIDGWVLVEITVLNNGAVSKVRVLDASPRGIFEDSAIACVEGWRYESFEGPARRFTQTLPFKWQDYPRNNNQLK